MANEINGLSAALEGLSITNKTATVDKSLGQDTFLKLMIAQLKNQDPTSPMESQEFLQQLAQFSTVSGINNLQTSVSSLATSLQSSQALQASTMVGRNVLVASESLPLTATGSASGAIELSEAATNLGVSVYDRNGTLVKRIDLGSRSAGLVNFDWDGTNVKGEPVPQGSYKLKAEAIINNETVAYPTYINEKVNSVTLQRNGAGPLLNLSSLGTVTLDQLKQIM
jgi:flagellar basal-body rod modification protein FlgD